MERLFLIFSLVRTHILIGIQSKLLKKYHIFKKKIKRKINYYKKRKEKENPWVAVATPEANLGWPASQLRVWSSSSSFSFYK
jgi:hypothetical protein